MVPTSKEVFPSSKSYTPVPELPGCNVNVCFRSTQNTKGKTLAPLPPACVPWQQHVAGRDVVSPLQRAGPLSPPFAPVPNRAPQIPRFHGNVEATQVFCKVLR